VEQLKKTPSDNALREQIIKLVPTLKPAPALPDAAITFEGRAQFAFNSAKSENDFLVAAQEYEKAVAAAPWVPGYYADLCTIYEKAGKFEAAKRHCGFYLTSLTDPAQITDVKRRIAGLEFGIEKALVEPRAPNLARLQGTWVKAAGEMVQYYRLLAEGDTIKISAYQYVTPGEGTVRLDPAFWGEYRLKAAKGEFAGVYVAGTQIKACTGRETPAVATLSADGNEITLTTTGWYDNPSIWDPRGWNTADTKSCAYDSTVIGRFVIRKQP
ncbi:MAG: hypothetical protein WCD00_05145, partial [Desulfuromonadaceae bacterium]